MSDNTPDRWIVIKITNKEDGTFCHKVFANWYGGYLGSDSWKLNSGITEAKENDGRIEFSGYSGSVYNCYKGSYGTSGYGGQILANWINDLAGKADVEILPEDTNFLECVWDNK